MALALDIDPELSVQENFMAGKVILIDKPLEWTSFDVVKKIRYALKIKKIGHAGTLDPLATGLLILCTGKKTKSIESFMADEKEYRGSFVLGQTTPSYDLETTPTDPVPTDHISEEELKAAIAGFEGEIDQIPPQFSAIKVDGKRLYQHARKGEHVEVKARRVFISKFKIERLDLPEVHFRVVCSKGTYIRSLANDVGEKLGVGAYLKSLQRTRIGEMQLADAWPLKEFIDAIKNLP